MELFQVLEKRDTSMLILFTDDLPKGQENLKYRLT